jgi:hypothetical protein
VTLARAYTGVAAAESGNDGVVVTPDGTKDVSRL